MKSLLKSAKVWMYLSMMSGVTCITILCFIIAIRNRITPAIYLVKEGSRYISNTIQIRMQKRKGENFRRKQFSWIIYRAVTTIGSSVIFPILPWLAYITIISFGIYVAFLIKSIRWPFGKLVEMNGDQYCKCHGLACDYVKVHAYSHPFRLEFTVQIVLVCNHKANK